MNSRRFTHVDQSAFAAISGDFNPMHVDPIRARRMLFGKLVVHGVHVLMWVLNEYHASRTTESSPSHLKSIKATFIKPVGVGEIARWLVTKSASTLETGDNLVNLSILVDEIVVMRIRTTWSRSQQHESRPLEPDLVSSIVPDRTGPGTPADIRLLHGNLGLWLDFDQTAAMFPVLVNCLTSIQIAELLALTRLVGMVCPGLNSVFSELDISFSGDESTTTKDVGELLFSVSDFDERFSRVTMDVAAAKMHGRLLAFERPPTSSQPDYLHVAAGLENYLSRRAPMRTGVDQPPSIQVEQRFDRLNEANPIDRAPFAGQKALVIGGSRGLGEVTAKLLAAGGGDVRLTYRFGADEADEIVKDICGAGGTASAFALDIMDPKGALEAVISTGWKPTHLYYLATPFIFDGAVGIFSDRLYRQFCDYYVLGFFTLVKLLYPHGMRCAFYPSSSALDELPSNMAEYIAAKSAGEALCGFLEKHNRGLTIHRTRLQRLATDQTVNLLPVENADPLQTLLPHLMDMTTTLR